MYTIKLKEMKKLFLILIIATFGMIAKAQYVPIIATDTIGDITRYADVRITHWDNVMFQMTVKTFENRNGLPFIPVQQTHVLNMYHNQIYVFTHNGNTFTHTGSWFLGVIFASVDWDLVASIGLNMWRLEVPNDTLFIEP